jgi:adenosyl cobinamide kinase/adenosyl cobinamide phosphate guanylyltransferase
VQEFIGGIIPGIVVFILIVGAFIFGQKSGKDAANESKKTTYDATLDYLTPINSVIEREFAITMHRRTNSTNADAVARVKNVIQSLKSAKEMQEVLTEVLTNVLLRSSKNVRNAFYRIYDRDDDDSNLKHYVGHYIMTKLREITIQVALDVNGSDFNEKKYADQFILNVENRMRDHLGFHDQSNPKA